MIQPLKMKIKDFGLFSLKISFALIPPLIALFILQIHNVDMPVGDQIRNPGTHFEAIAMGTFEIGDLFSLFNDSRKAVPSAIILLLSTFDGLWLQSRERVVAIVLGMVSVIFMAIIYQKTFPNKKRLQLLLTIIFASLYFAPASYYRWSYAPLHRTLPDFFLICSCLVYTLQIPLWRKTFFYSLTGIFAQLSFASGLFIWPCNLLLLIFDNCYFYQKKKKLFILISVAILSITLYFSGDYNLHTSGHEAQSLIHILQAFPTLSLAAFGRYIDPSAVTLIGYLLFFLLTIFVVIAWKTNNFNNCLPFFVLCIWIIILSVPISLRRADLIVNPVESSRYYNSSAIFLIGFISLIFAIGFLNNSRWQKQTVISVFTGLLLLLIHQNNNSLWLFKAMRSDFLNTKTHYELINFIPEEWLSSRYGYTIDNPSERLKRLSNAGILPFSPLQKFPPTITDITQKDRPKVEGEVTSLEITNSKLIAYGWAAIEETPADSVVFVHQMTLREREVLSIDNVYDPRQKLSKEKGIKYFNTGWYTEIELNHIIAKDHIKIYAYDSDTRKLYLLPLINQL